MKLEHFFNSDDRKHGVQDGECGGNEGEASCGGARTYTSINTLKVGQQAE